MSKRIDERIPKEIGIGVLPSHAAVKSPWEKLVSYRDAAHYCQRYTNVFAAAMMQAYRIMVPDYVERSKYICANAYNRLDYTMDKLGYAAYMMEDLGVHPFLCGQFSGALIGDSGDETLLMCGRVCDFGTYRAEKELDVCYWDVVGSELCRSTTQSLQACADAFAKRRHAGPSMEYHMVEAKGCGDRHCRIVAESREKYPMPPHEQWECFGPVATADQIKFTTEEYTVGEPMVLRGECDNRFVNGTCQESDYTSLYPAVAGGGALAYIMPTIDDIVAAGVVTDEMANHIIKCVCEASGKAAFGEDFAKEGLRTWLGAPHDVDDGRLMGAYIEMYLQCMRVPYEIEAFNKDEVIYTLDPAALSCNMPRSIVGYVSLWYGMTKTLINPMWALWEEDSPEGKLRIKIAKKIDKFC